VATRVELDPAPGAVARRGGVPIDPSQPLHVIERTELELAPFGRIVLSPGAGELDGRRAALARAEEQVARALGSLGAASLAAAEALHAERRRLETELSVAQARLRAVLRAEGVEHPSELRDRLAERRTRHGRLAADGVVAGEGGIEQLREQLAAVDAERQRLARERDAARTETERCAKAVSDRRETLARLESIVEQIAAQRRAVAEQLAAERAELADEVLARQLEEAEHAKQRVDADLANLQRQILAADPDLARERAAQAERRVRQLEEELTRLGDAIREQEAELRGLGADAVGELLEECRQRLALAEDEVARLRRQARAWRLLRDELQAAASAARDALLAPVRARLVPYLRRLFPTSEAVLDPETLALTHLRRDGTAERFEQLSLGTREQIAVLVRLALARLLHEIEGEAPCLLLDDALVYADETRFDVMKAILQQAARELQILILTCRPRDYLGLDARQIRLAEQVSPPGA
jgi:DNA repair exonuclease SbcCD ATPase subunit